MKAWSGDPGAENPNYIREFDARVVGRSGNRVVLDRTAFYPTGGGQPSDTGVLRWEGGESKVAEVLKRDGIVHVVDVAPAGDEVHGVLDWPRRYAHMRMHTAQHVISGVVFDDFGGRTVGNQIHAETSRVDFQPVKLSPEDLTSIERRCNGIISASAPVRIYEEEREALEKRVNEQRCNLDLLPESVRVLRVVEIEGFDVCPCAGTHVGNAGEIGSIRILRKENKGKERERLVYELV